MEGEGARLSPRKGIKEVEHSRLLDMTIDIERIIESQEEMLFSKDCNKLIKNSVKDDNTFLHIKHEFSEINKKKKRPLTL